MKLKILVKIVEKLLGMTDNGDAPRADMYLPDRLVSMALVSLSGGVVCTVFAVVKGTTWAIVGAAVGIVLGVLALLCWKNQTIHILSDEQFTYTTMFGNTRTYSFSDIQELRKNQDSHTLFVANEKVHIESMAVLSDRLVNRIHCALQKTVETNPTETIEDVFGLPDDELLNALSRHLQELSRNGDALDGLNEYERTVYYADELCMEVGSGGFDSYLTYRGTHFEQAYAALTRISALEARSVLDAVRDKFPQGHIPKREDALESAMDELEENDVDFEVEDDRFYSVGEKELVKRLLSYVKENRSHFG